jgi:NADP-dependent 3-hydroxy acid dehydrogenase YdfG
LAANREYQPELLLQPADVAHLIVNALSLGTTAELTELRVRPRHRPIGRSAQEIIKDGIR